MGKEDISARLRQFIRQRFAIPGNDPDFNDDIDLFNYGYIDSFGAVELTTFIESEFDLKLTESDWATFALSTVNQISDFVLRRRTGES